MEKMSASEIARVVNSLRSTGIPIYISTKDVMVVADEMAEVFPDAVHVGLGGLVSRGRFAGALADEYLDPEQEQTIIFECHSFVGNGIEMMNEIIQFFSNENKNLRHSRTVSIFIATELPTPLSSRSITLTIKGED